MEKFFYKERNHVFDALKFFAKNIVSYSFGEIIKKKGRQLLLPSICMGIILLVPKNCIRGGINRV